MGSASFRADYAATRKSGSWVTPPNEKSYPRSVEIALCVVSRRTEVILSAKTRFPHPPRTATTTAAPTAPTATASTAAATAAATASAAASLSRCRRRGHSKSRQGNSLEEVHSHHRYRCQDIGHSLQTYSTRHVSCHFINPSRQQCKSGLATPARQTHVSYRLNRLARVNALQPNWQHALWVD
jgi:hypothetical protein